MSTNEPNVRLKLSSRSENVALVRAVLAGVAEAIELDAEQLDDIRTAVTEACNNAVLHAYEGGEGPLEVDVRLPSEGRVAVVVRDAGIGIEPRDGAPAAKKPAAKKPAAKEPAAEEPVAEEPGSEALDGEIQPGSEIPGIPDEESLKLGLPVIQALAAEVELRRPAGGGTEVRMTFATPGSRLPERGNEDQAGAAPSLELLPAIGPEGERPELIAAATIAIAPDRLARTVLPRLVCALAARANFSTDRLSDAQLVADVIAAEAFRTIIGSHLGVGIAVEPRRVELRVGPLPIDRESEAKAADAALGELGVVVERLIDDHSIAPVGSAAVLALQLIDRR
jgi:anti-sigma regulatory factor (Ser/Thr protein kinase)